ncbi:hypothetical protein BC831DRAFT_469276 [Entophlyctis helioformis]|nr:hypothetical protein BC831DRAFT_469276 [Entophlyctis helioformis]
MIAVTSAATSTSSRLAFFPSKGAPEPALAGSTLLLPGPNGIGFVGQLVLDLVIATLRLQRVGIIDCPDVAAAVGIDSYGPWDPPSPRTAVEVYHGQTEAGETITAVQMRSRVDKGRGVAFADSLASWTKTVGFARTVILTGLDGLRRTDAQINSTPLRYSLVSPASLSAFPRLPSLNWTEMEASEELYLDNPARIPPGGGLTRFLMDAGARDESLPPAVVISWFAIEGDNMGAVHAFVDALDDLVGLRESKGVWAQPLSWEGIYGREQFTRDLF